MSKKDYREHFAEQLRMTLLRLLTEADFYRTNSIVLQLMTEKYAFDVSPAQIRTALAWLAEQQLVTTERLSDDITTATLTERGLDVARGRAHVPGVAREVPGA